MSLAQLLVPFLEIMIITVMLNYLLGFFWNTRAMDLVFGILAFLALYALARWLHFPVLQTLMLNVVNVAVLAVLIIFQPELRIALSRLSVKGRKYREVTEFDRFLENICQSVYRLAERRIGAIIILENQDSLEEYAQKAVLLNAGFSSELLESIFTTTTPLHDGAVIIREMTIISAATILPLADDMTQLAKSMGTRHRAALGISQTTDALAIVVSEETGRVSVAREGIMTRGVRVDRFKGILRSIFTPPKMKTQTRLTLMEWLRQ
ncbi:MAG: diadenylate cyclase CdaA [Chlamydiia bacterium]|nr:diadenylate cyclase CdaA [Chlamydiia bacterium]